ncbi:MAG: hypothetical protein Kow0074_19680 [Candidatus Zixiibacteriota bacterium]
MRRLHQPDRFDGLVAMLVFALLVMSVPPDVSALDRSAWTNFTNMNSIADVISRGDTIWLATTGGLLYLPNGNQNDAVRITNLEGLGGNALAFITAGPGDAIWTGGAEARLSRRWSDVGWSVYPFLNDGAPIPLNCAIADSNGFLWVGSNLGLHKFDIARNGGEIKETYTRIGAWTSSSVADIAIVDGRIWIAGPAGVASADVDDQFLLDPSRWTTWSQPDGVRSLAASMGTIWAGGEDGLWRLNGDPAVGTGEFEFVAYQSLPINDMFGGNDTLWLATSRGLARVSESGPSGVPLAGTPDRDLTSVELSDAGLIWCGTAGAGLLRVEGSVSTLIAFDGPVDNDIVDIAVDADGRPWCVHPTLGLDYLDNGIWTHLGFTDALVGSSGPATGVDVAPDGTVWFSMWGGGGMRIDPESPTSGYTHYDTSNSALMFVTDPGGPNNYIVARDVSVDPSGRVWFANAFADSGVRLVYNDHGCWGRFGVEDGISSNDLMVVDAQDDYVLIGFSNLGLGEFTYNQPLCVGGEPSNAGGDLVLRRTFDGLPSDQVQAVLVDRADTLWAGTNAGLVRWIPDLRGFFSVALPAEAGLSINALAADAFNTLWIGTSRGLVARRSNGDTEFYTPYNSPLVGRDVRAIAIDDRRGVAWIGTGSGVSRIVTGAAPVDNIEQVLALPNPFEIVTGEAREVRFNAPFGSHVYIYTVSGELVADLDVSLGWDGRTRDGTLVASGIYLFVVRGPDGTYGRGKLAVIQTR